MHQACAMCCITDITTLVQSLSCVWIFETPWTATCQASLSFTLFQSLLKLMSTDSVMPSNRLILCHPLLLLPSIFPSIRVFSNELALCIRWPKFWSFSISPSNEYSELIYFMIDWFDLLAVLGTLKSLLQNDTYSSKDSSKLNINILILWLGRRRQSNILNKAHKAESSKVSIWPQIGWL